MLCAVLALNIQRNIVCHAISLWSSDLVVAAPVAAALGRVAVLLVAACRLVPDFPAAAVRVRPAFRPVPSFAIARSAYPPSPLPVNAALNAALTLPGKRAGHSCP